MEKKQNIKNKVFEGLFWKFSERIIAQLITFVVSIVLARILSPNEYGTIALVMVFIALADVFVSSGFGNALIQKKNSDDVDFSSVFYFNIVFSIIIYLLLYLCAPIIASFYSRAELVLVLRVLAIRIPIAAINSVQQAFVSKHMLFKRFFYSTLFGTVLSGVVGIIMAYQGYGIWALVAQYLTNTVVDTITLWFTVKWRPKKAYSWKRIRTLYKYGWKLLCSGLLETGYTQLRSLIIGKIYSSSDLAFYNKGDQIPNLLVTNINTSISSVLFPAISFYQDSNKQVKSMTRRAIRISSYVMWPLMIGLFVTSESIIHILLTDKWLDCVPFLQCACISYAFWPIHTANLEALKAIGRSDLFLKLEIIKKILGVIVICIAIRFGVLAIALSAVIISFLSSFINAYPNTRLLGYSYLEQVKDIFPSILLSACMGIIISVIPCFTRNSYILLVLQVIAGGLVYVGGSMLLKFESFYYIKDTLIHFFVFKE